MKTSERSIFESQFELTVNGEQWKRLDSVGRASPNDAVYSLDRKSGEISFGDGVHGRRLPADGAAIRASYKYGAGDAGAVDDELTLSLSWSSKNLNENEVIGVKIEPKADGIIFQMRREVELPRQNKWAALLCQNLKRLSLRLKCR